MRTLALHQLTVMDVASPAELVSVAAEAGYNAVDIFIQFRAGPWPFPAMIAGPNELAQTRARLSDTGLRVHNLESFPLVADFDFDSFRAKLEMGALLGAERVTVFLVDPDLHRREANFVRAAEVAADFGIELGIEAAPINALSRTAEIAAFVARTGVANARCVIDLLHTHRNGETPETIVAVGPRFIGSVQVTDGPRLLPTPPAGGDVMARRMDEAMEQRLFPGEGELPLRAFLDSIDADLPISVEAPHRQAQQAGLGPAERAARALAGLRRLLG